MTTKRGIKEINNNKNQIFSTKKVIEKEKELKEHPERDRVKTVKIAAEKEKKRNKKISKNGGKEN